MKNNYTTLSEQFPKFNRKMIETGKINISYTHIHDHSLFGEIKRYRIGLKVQVWLIVDFCLYPTSVDKELYCPKGKCGCQYFILLTLKKKIHGHRGPGFF